MATNNNLDYVNISKSQRDLNNGFNNNIEKKTFPNLLLPKKSWNIIRDKSQSSQDLLRKEYFSIKNIKNIQNNKNQPVKLKANFQKKSFNNNPNLLERQFYKTSGTGFNYRIKNFQKVKKFIDKECGNKTNFIYNDSYEKNDTEQMLLRRIDAMQKELENNENTFIYNQKIMKKKLNEKEKEIILLKNELQKEKENKNQEYENILNENNNNFMNVIKKYNKRIESLKNQNLELTEKNFENEKHIEELENKNKDNISKLNDLTQKYTMLIEDKAESILEDDIKEYIKEINERISEQQNDINSMNEELTYLNQENRRLKNLTKEIIQSRNETEIFFLDALNEAKRDLYKLKKEQDKRGSFFPTLKSYYEISNPKVDIRDLTPEMREKILRNLFEKINKGYSEKNYRELNNIMEADLSDVDENI